MQAVTETKMVDEARSAETVSGSEHVRRVLIVDDSRLQRKILTSLVKGWGFEAYEADTGNAGLEVALSVQPDIILSDWMMPGMNGLEFCQAFRERCDEHYVYFILLTSKSEKDEVARGLDSGADDLLTKPVNAHELRARIRAGERILQMQHELTNKNQIISETLDELQRLYDSLDDDLLEAKKLQQSLIPERSVTFDTGEVTLMLQQCGHVGGDLVGYFPAGKKHVGMYSIDVSGHGISSALMTARLAGYLSAIAPEHNIALEQDEDGGFRPRAPEAVIEELNNLILGDLETELYFTLILAAVELETGKVCMSQAGHPHPAVQRADGSVEIDGPGGLPVGLIPGATFSQFDMTLNPGDRLLLLSDGVSECPAADGTMLEETGVAKLLQELAGVSGSALFESLMWKLSEFSELQAFPDDVSGILFEYRP